MNAALAAMTTVWRLPRGVLALVALLWSAAATANNGGGFEPPPISVEAAQNAILAGDLAGAREMLEEMLRADPDSLDALFLMGEIESRLGNHAVAAALYRRMLVRQPDLARVRLELAEALFLLGDDEQAEYHFRFALAGALPDPVARNVRRYLDVIRGRKHFVWDVSAGLQQDSNLNAAPRERQVTIFGLPFLLSEDLERESGLGLLVRASAEYRPPIADGARFRMGGDVLRAEYEGSDFDDLQLASHLGPQFRIGSVDLSTLLALNYRLLANEPYSAGIGPRIEIDWTATDRIRLQLRSAFSYVDYVDQDVLDGSVVGLGLTGHYWLSPNIILSGSVVGGFRDARRDPFSYRYYGFGLSYQHELPYGFNVAVQPDITLYDFEAPLPFFERTREDQTYRVSISIANRALSVFDFTPEVAYTFSDNRSNIPIHDYVRHQVTFGFTRRF